MTQIRYSTFPYMDITSKQCMWRPWLHELASAIMQALRESHYKKNYKKNYFSLFAPSSHSLVLFSNTILTITIILICICHTYYIYTSTVLPSSPGAESLIPFIALKFFSLCGISFKRFSASIAWSSLLMCFCLSITLKSTLGS